MTNQSVYIKAITRITVDAVVRIHFNCEAANLQRHPIDKMRRKKIEFKKPLKMKNQLLLFFSAFLFVFFSQYFFIYFYFIDTYAIIIVLFETISMF